MAKIVLTLLDGKVLTRDNKAIGSDSGCCCCFCSETCERCVLVDAPFDQGIPPHIVPPIYQLLDKKAFAPEPPYCAEIVIAKSYTTAQWTIDDVDASGQGDHKNYSLSQFGVYAEEVEANGNKKYKTRMGTSIQTWYTQTQYVSLPDNNLYVAYVAPSGDSNKTRKQLYLFCLKGDGTDGPFAKTTTPKKIFNIDIDLHECGWVLVIQNSTCGLTVDWDSSCSMNFARIPSDETGCPELGDYRTVEKFLSPTEIAAKDPPIECPTGNLDKLGNNVVCEGVYGIADCDSRQAAALELPGHYNNSIKFWPRTNTNGGWGATAYGIKVRRTLRKTTALPLTVGTTLCCVPDAPESYYYFINSGDWSILSNWRVGGNRALLPLEGGPCGVGPWNPCADSDIPTTYVRVKWISGGKIPLVLPTKLDRVVIQKSVTGAAESTSKVFSMDVIDTGTKLSVTGTITTTEFSLFDANTELIGTLLGAGKIIFKKNSEVNVLGKIGNSTATSNFTLIKFKDSSINKGSIYHRVVLLNGTTNIAESILRFVNFHDTSSNHGGANVYYTPARFYNQSTNKGTVCTNFPMNDLVDLQEYPRSYFEDESTNTSTGKVVGAATFNNLSQNLNEIDNSVDPHVNKSTNSVKFYNSSVNGPTGYTKGYAEFYNSSVNYGDVDKDLTLYELSSCLYQAGNVRGGSDSINIGQNLIMKDLSRLGDNTHTLTIKIDDAFTTGDSDDPTTATILITNCIIEVENDTNLYGNTTVTDSNISCTTNDKIMSINHTSVTMDQEDMALKRTIEYDNVNFYNSSINGAKIQPNSSNITTFYDLSTNKSEDIDGILIFNNYSKNNVTRTTDNTFISITFNGYSANLGYITTTDTNKNNCITFNNDSYNDANALIRGNVIFNDTSQNKGVGVVDIAISIDPSSATLYDTVLVVTYPKPTTQNNSCTFSPLNPSPITISGNTISHNQAFTSYIQANSSKCRREALLETTVDGVVSNDYTYDTPANDETEGNWYYFVDDDKRLIRYDDWFFWATYIWDIPSEVIITTTHNTTGESFNTTLNITFTPPAELPGPETHPSPSFQVSPSNTVTGNTIAYNSASTSIVNGRTADNLTVAALVTTPMVPGGYTYSINSIHYEITNDYLSRKQDWFLDPSTQDLAQNIPTSLTVTTTNTATSETFETILTITYAPPE